MSAPALQQYIQGITSVSADNLNTFLQTCDTIVQLRDLVGAPGMEVLTRGLLSVGDGGAGTYYWNALSAGPDNGRSIIVPNGVGLGAWVLLQFGTSVIVVTTPATLIIPASSSAVYEIEAAVTAIHLPSGFTQVGPIVIIDAIGTFLTNPCTVTAPGSETISGQASIQFSAAYQVGVFWPLSTGGYVIQ